MSPKATFIYNDTQKEAHMLCFNAKSIAGGQYQKAGFFVLDKLHNGQYHAIHYPNLNYSKNFWKTLTLSKSVNYEDVFSPKCTGEIEKKLKKNHKQIEKQTVQNLIKEWKSKETKFYKLIKDLLDAKKIIDSISEIEILVTNYGASGSFYPTKVGNKYKIMMTHRVDFPADFIAKTLLLCILKIKMQTRTKTGDAKWYKRQDITDFLLSETMFTKLFPKIKNFSTPDKNGYENLKLESDKYLNELGFPIKKVISISNSGVINIHSNSVDGLFTEQEQKLIHLLTAKAPHMATYDEISDHLWKDRANEKYSLYAISKLVEGVRKKLRDQGVNKNIILTCRNKGYLLND